MPLPSDGGFASEIATLRERTNLSIGYSGDWGMADAMLTGADAFYSVLGGTLPDPVLAMVRAAQAGNTDAVRKIDARLAALWDTFKAFGSLRVMYVLVELTGLGRLAPPRPILPLEGKPREKVVAAWSGPLQPDMIRRRF